MLREAREWFKDYGKAFKYGVSSGLLLGFDTAYYVRMGKDVGDKVLSPLALVLTGFLAGGLMNECGREIRDTYHLRKTRKGEKIRELVSDTIQ